MQEKIISEKQGEEGNTPELNKLYQRLKKDFDATFVTELMPGILHNFANPLNGIMGRTQILQRRMRDTIAKIGAQYPDTTAAFLEPINKLTSDIAAICQESDRFYYMFQDVSGKLYTIGSAAPERINLSRLLVAELRFADYYLDFKHELRKELDLEDSLPDIYGISGHYSLCFGSLFRSAMDRMKDSSEKVIYISTTHDNLAVMVRLRYHGRPWTEEEKKALDFALSAGDLKLPDDGHSLSRFCLSLSLLRQSGARIDCCEREGWQEIVIRVSY
jgi:hypothetical protein